MSIEHQRVTLSKAQRDTAPGRELLALLTELSADGQVTREEMARLRQWLELDRGIDFPACGFLYEVLDSISQDGEITEEELDSLAQAIERVLPADVRILAASKRKERREARRKETAVARAAQRQARTEAREHAKPLGRFELFIAGCRRAEGRRDACALLSVGDAVTLEREPDNVHDCNAILILGDGDSELGYVPREVAREMAPLLDAGAQAQASIKKLHEAKDGFLVPIVIASIYRAGAAVPRSAPHARQHPVLSGGVQAVVESTTNPPSGRGPLMLCVLLAILGLAWMAM